MLKPGINKDISNTDYHGDREYISSTGLKLMFKDPREYHRQYVLGDFTNAPKGASLDFGSYLHMRILEPHLENIEFAIYPGRARTGKKWEEFKAEHEGKIILLEMQKKRADALMENYTNYQLVLDHPERGTEEVPGFTFFQGGQAEETMCAELDGVKVKVRFDYRKEWETFGSINDVKTTGDEKIDKAGIEKICARWGYDISAALYIDVAEKVIGKKHDFYFLFISTSSGNIELVKASNQMIENGRRKYKEAIKRLKKARATGKYFENKIIEIESPEWDVWEPKDDNT